MVAKIHFDVHVEDRTEITANKGEISMGMRIIPHIGKPRLTETQDLADALIQQFGKKGYGKRLTMGFKVTP